MASGSVGSCFTRAQPARRSRLRRSALFGRSGEAALRAAFGGWQCFEGLALRFEGWASRFEGWASRFDGWALRVEGWASRFEGWVPKLEDWASRIEGSNCEAQPPCGQKPGGAALKHRSPAPSLPKLPKGTLRGPVLGYEVFASPGRKGDWAPAFQNCLPRFCARGPAKGSSGGG